MLVIVAGRKRRHDSKQVSTKLSLLTYDMLLRMAVVTSGHDTVQAVIDCS